MEIIKTLVKATTIVLRVLRKGWDNGLQENEMNLEKQALIVLRNWWKITIGRKKQKIRSLRKCPWHVYLGITSENKLQES